MKTKMERRCAIYTRKSSEQGLEQDFNSLDAQREAAVAYIQSQRHEGWKLISNSYDDGGYSGGTLERPAMKELLLDVEAGKIDVVVVYKVDRLTRSLADFAKLVEIFDRKGVSFVSVTQHFNTTNSMGRLTLNVLLSFAQFEREVTGERIRDKFAASKQKGMWMGGYPPLGYDVQNRKLIINEGEAETVRLIFRSYLGLSCVARLKAKLDLNRIYSKHRISVSGRVSGGVPWSRGALYALLKNRIYIGEIVHKDKSYPGEHAAILDRSLWDQVQERLAENRQRRNRGVGASNPSLLAGRLRDENGSPMYPSHGRKNGVRYRYYVSRSASTSAEEDKRPLRAPAHDLEELVLRTLRERLADQRFLIDELKLDRSDLDVRQHLLSLGGMAASESPTALVEQLEVRVNYGPRLTRIELSALSLLSLLRLSADASRSSIVIEVPTVLKRYGAQKRILVPGKRAAQPVKNEAMIKAIVQAHIWHRRLVSGASISVRQMAREEGVTPRYIHKLLPIAYLAPDITMTILDGAQPPEVTLKRLTEGLPTCWARQRHILGLI